MTIHFYLRFHTSFGQSLFISGNFDVPGNDKIDKPFPLLYLNDEFWHGAIEIPDINEIEEINYTYLLRNEDGTQIIEGETGRVIKQVQLKANQIVLIDTWNHAGTIENAFYTKPFREVIFASLSFPKKIKPAKNCTHEFRVKSPLLNKNEMLFITGSGKTLKEWNTKNPLLLTPEGNWFTIKLNLAKEKFPVVYKYGIYNIKEKAIQVFETGRNRILRDEHTKHKYAILHDGFVQFQRLWKGAGVAIPVFSLRSKNSFGVGEFSDIKLLIDWAKQTGLKLVQILPVNDTSATNTWLDSYPYAAISAFALHPLYINLAKVAGTQNTPLTKSLTKKQKALNDLAEYDYEQVMKFKISILKEIYLIEKDTFKDNTDYFEFFDINRHWLVPYAVFCFLKDKYRTSDFTKWKTNKIYNEDAVQKLASPGQKFYDDIAFHYFIQYHLHVQLKEAADYAHEKKVVLKGDIPIGIFRYGADAWVNPELYYMNEQAGAPPDDFAVKGQNWGFPTYNWAKMKEDGFSWWRQRFDQMSPYFDAFRIDHILGFFRIWSIPLHAVEGILGRFSPAIPIHINEFNERGIWFNYDRYCKPFITETIVKDTFGESATFVKEKFLALAGNEFYQLKEEFDTQRKIKDYFQQQEIENADFIVAGLFNLVSNIILIEDEDSQLQQFHFRISMDQTTSFRQLEANTRNQLMELYFNYFFHRQDEFWKREAMQKLPELKRSTNMLICGEDLGMVPHCVPDVMKQLGILSLEIQRMPKNSGIEFFHPKNAPYLSVVTPTTHDMSTIRGWWEEDRNKTQHFYNYMLGHYGEAPFFCEPWINKEIILQHLYSPAMWSIFLIQDIIGMSGKLRREKPQQERINVPSQSNYYWQYRMHINLEDLIKEKAFNEDLKKYVTESGRGNGS
ncbi:MAG: 4-alpha-glucanotransferase [Ginsengibacter sp.]